MNSIESEKFLGESKKSIGSSCSDRNTRGPWAHILWGKVCLYIMYLDSKIIVMITLKTNTCWPLLDLYKHNNH